MYFDVVFTDMHKPVFNGTPEEVRAWIEENCFNDDRFHVCDGRTLHIMTASEYMARK